ncbi:hypothetical protein BSL82_15635 [Tardibacter chloracetimidivorans]|uniref:Uncharacterized protein n=1 Tax=Tardibacter chloracetimidivorans TaxID=1921510 RepID=A0A1L3ZY26_9SPHN|nr:hypothetical protein [Tardibacter chloracetimidivorans]API60536.1 hypothetical protein BSL82_15635 [Tardibacter chloracetimidivorans]
MSLQTVTGVLASALATSGTFTVGYPGGANDRGKFASGTNAKLVLGGRLLSQPEDMTLSYGASTVTVTYKGATTMPAGTSWTFQFDEYGTGDVVADATSGAELYKDVKTVLINLGSPGAIDTDGVAEAQAVAGAADLTLDGDLVSDGVAVLDARYGRNVIIDSSGAGDTTQTATVYGTDYLGNTVIETIAFNGTTAVAGKKAFKTITRIAISAALAGNGFVGTGDVLGLPVYLPAGGLVLKEIEDGAIATSGTLVAGLAVNTPSTATTADVRGTYDPNSACDGSKGFALIAALPDPGFLGNPQYDG